MTLMVMYQEKGDKEKALMMQEKIDILDKKLNK